MARRAPKGGKVKTFLPHVGMKQEGPKRGRRHRGAPVPPAGGEKNGRQMTEAGVSARKDIFAYWVAYGLSDSAAAREAGETSVRAIAGVLGSEWRKEPEVQALISKHLADQMAGLDDVDQRMGLMLAGRHPTKIVYNADGTVKELEHDIVAVCRLLYQRHGALRERIEHTGPEGKPLAARISDEELQARISELAIKGGLLSKS